jgi:hypothetical protein
MREEELWPRRRRSRSRSILQAPVWAGRAKGWGSFWRWFKRIFNGGGGGEEGGGTQSKSRFGFFEIL